ncbi:GNAT family N-acetyltransferase [Chitinimonas prasina]|nr:GNAT family N-acetyltransferase [Chitinimonas prasina]
MMHLRLAPIQLDDDFAEAYAMRRDSYQVSFGTTEAFDRDAGPAGELYRARLAQRCADYPDGYVHAWLGDEIVGQLEVRHEPDQPGHGYVHLFYLLPAWRHQGLGGQLHDYAVDYLRRHGCHTARLSVDRHNAPALAFYRRHGWRFDAANPKHPTTDFLRLDLSPGAA